MKYLAAGIIKGEDLSCPARGTWIEMQSPWTTTTGQLGSCPARGTWIEILTKVQKSTGCTVVPRKRHDGLLSNL